MSLRHIQIDCRVNPVPLFVFLFSFTLFLSAALMFTVQPMIGKMMLPMIGGAPAGWLVTMAYFQLVLLAGYALAHVFSRFSPRRHMLAVLAVLMVGFAFLPLRLEDRVLETGLLSEPVAIAAMLFLALTVPVLGLGMMSPSLQRLYGSGSDSFRRNPYFLFAASNLGSFGGLLAYPLWIERASGLSIQSTAWRWGYVGLIALCALCIAVAGKESPQLSVREESGSVRRAALAWTDKVIWVLLAFVPSSLMMGATAHVTSETGGVPLFWVLPLALYLLTFVQAFARTKPLGFKYLRVAQPLSVAFLMLPLAGRDMGPMYYWYVKLLDIIVFFLTARLCHELLAARKPYKEHLTAFYLWVSVGGALGGLFNAFLAPVIFSTAIEFMLIAWASLLVHFLVPGQKGLKIDKTLIVGAACAAVTVFLRHRVDGGLLGDPWATAAQIAMVLSFVVVSLRPWFLAVAIIASSLYLGQVDTPITTLDNKRNFFGVLHVREEVRDDMTMRRLVHGTTFHGEEKIKPQIDTTPHGYFDVHGPLGDVMSLKDPRQVGMIGLGAGTVICYQAPGRTFTVFEIDPDVVMMATKWFDFVRTCGSPEIRVGDGRKMLEREKGGPYDVFVIDAFSSDAIPAHLLTLEAMRLYFSRLGPDGVLAVHISNNFYDLRYPLSAAAHELGLAALSKRFEPVTDKHPLALASEWVALARSGATLEPLREQGWGDLPATNDKAWTDDFTDTLSALGVFIREAGSSKAKEQSSQDNDKRNDLKNAQTH